MSSQDKSSASNQIPKLTVVPKLQTVQHLLLSWYIQLISHGLISENLLANVLKVSLILAIRLKWVVYF